MDARLRTPLILLALFFVAWIPRALALDAFVTPDERKWLARSANFWYALDHGDFAGTFQREHPGVTIMAAGALGLRQQIPDYPQIAPGQFAWEREEFEAWVQETTGQNPLDLLVAGRWWIVLGVALAIALGVLPLRRLFGLWPALLASLWIALDPFSVALSRQLHPDGFVSALTFLALLLFLAWLYAGRRRRDLVASGFVMGLAWLTKTPAIFLALTGALLIALEWWRGRKTQARGDAWQLAGALVAWGAIATLVFVAFWPSMWVDPFGTLARMAGEMGEYVERHTNINYFWGRPTEDPGPLFYPVAWFFRTTPAVLVGLIAEVWAARRRFSIWGETRTRRAAFALLLFALLFAAGMTVGAKKFDRYILPAFLSLDVLAALGWYAIGVWAAERWKSARAGVAVAAGGLVLLHGLFTAIHFPYYLTYFNPLAGGSRTAPFALWVGWGEGLDAAAGWLNAQPEAEDQRAAAFYYDGPFSYYYDGAAANLGSGSPLLWMGVDYAVTYASQWQRQIPDPQVVAWFETQTPVHTVRFRGLDLARIYDLGAAPLPAFLDIAKENAADFGGQIRLLAYEVDPAQVAPGGTTQVTFYLQSLTEMERNYNVLVRLVARDGQEVWRGEGWPWGAPTSDWPVREVRPDGHTIALPDSIAPGLYRLLLSFYDPETLEPLAAADPSGAPLDSPERAVAMVQVGTPRPAVPLRADFGGTLALVDASIDGQPAPGEPLGLRLIWESLARTATSYTVFVHVVAADGTVVAQADSPPQEGFAATNLLLPRQQAEETRSVPLPAGLAPGAYAVRLGLYDPATQTRLPVSIDGAPAGDSVDAATFTLP